MAIIWAVAGLAVAGSLLFACNWLFATRKTDSRLLGAPLLLRRWRSYRWFWFRIGLNLFAWPHVIDAVMGTRRAPVGITPNELVWSKGPVTLRRYGRGEDDPVLVVHSFVSKPWILDLAPGRSLIGFLVEEGFDVFLLDWGDPGAAEATSGLSSYADILRQAEQEVLERAGSERLHLVGYCLGGLLCLLRAGARRHPEVASIIVLATPVDFGIKVALQPLISHRLFKPVYFLDGEGCVPPEALRESFHILRPQALRTVIGAWRRRNDASFRQFYDPLARWVWEHRALSGQMHFDLVDLFRTNAFLRGSLIVSGELARLEDVEVPVLTLIAERDHIVPSASSHALAGVEGLDVTEVTLESGHVSMISGSTATTTTWPTIAQ
ncbi:MAG TPA: alpha/beta fold hydrolase, partial [Actinomycetota bacterium]|nr:alpha/beta fold hydrolase [Actinomycetota bacterium]